VKRLPLAFAVLLGSLLAAGPAPAAAETVTVGSPLTGSFTRLTFCVPLCVSANNELAAPGAQVTVPFDGTLTRWRTLDGKAGAFRVRVLRPDGAGEYVLSGASSPETPTGPGIDTFATSIPVKAGDLIGLENLSITAEIGSASPPGSGYHVWFGSFAEGSNTSSASGDFQNGPQELGFNADVERPSIVPPVLAPAPVAPQCVVPVLKGKKLKAAKRKIRAAGCKVGKVTRRKGARAAKAKVVGQAPKAGKTVAAGSAVKLTLGPAGKGKAGKSG